MNTQYLWFVLGLPLMGWLIQCLFGKRIVALAGRQAAGWISTLAVAVPFAFGVMLFSQMMSLPADQRAAFTIGFDWITLHNLSIPFELRADPLSLTMVLVVTGIGSLIHLYSIGYMSEEPDFPRFFAYLNLFVTFMLLLVMGNNLPMLFIGWEGVGLCSYLLIGFWYKDLANSKAANKAFIVNRIGDVGLVVGMGLLTVLMIQNREMLGETTRWLSYDVLLPKLPQLLGDNPEMATAIGLCLFLGACGKSAQFPLYVWLPDAMAGPTPVSALIHAATMVTAGVVLLNRFAAVFMASPFASAVVVTIGVITALMGALIAFGQTDIKKVLAYSTVSQLGFMFIACGVGAYWVGMFHVITHAFFKALLFLGSGAVIHAMAHEQDMRHYGNLNKYIKITCWTMVAGWIAIAGVPYTSGWFSKEEILHKAVGSMNTQFPGINYGYTAAWIGFGVALLTAIYMTRMMMLTFFGGQERWRAIPVAEGHGHGHHDDHAHDHGHEHHAHADHGPDAHGFFFTEEEMAARHAGDHDDHHHALDAGHQPHEVPWTMWMPLVILAVFSLGAGIWLHKGSMIGMENHLLENTLSSVYPHAAEAAHGAAHGAEHAAEAAHGAEHHVPYENLVGLLGYSIGILGMIIGVLWYAKGLPKSEGWDLSKWNPARLWARNQFGYDQFMVDAGVDGGEAVGNFLWKGVDVKIVDGAVNGIATVMSGIGSVFRKSSTGFARSYALMMLLGGVAIAGYLVYVLMRAGGQS